MDPRPPTGTRLEVTTTLGTLSETRPRATDARSGGANRAAPRRPQRPGDRAGGDRGTSDAGQADVQIGGGNRLV
jgi:hypothetical protein